MKITGPVLTSGLGALLLWALVSSMHGPKDPPPPPLPPPHEDAWIVVVLLDDTGSYQYFEASRIKIEEIVARLREDDLLYVIVVGPKTSDSDSLKVRPSFSLLAAIRNAPKRRHLRPEVEDYLNDFRQQVRSLRFQGQEGTDVYGALYSASSILEGENATKFLIICSDLGDTANRTELESKTRFDGVRVRCLFYPSDLITEKGKAIRPDSSFWQKKFLAWGAESVEIYRFAKSLAVDPLR